MELDKLSISAIGANFEPATLLLDTDIELLLTQQKMVIRRLDRDVTTLLTKEHKLNDTQKLKDKTIVAETNLTTLYDLLDDKIVEARAAKEDIAVKQELLKQCEQLISRNERIKKNLNDDLGTRRYYEPSTATTPMQAAGFVGAFPLTAAAVTKLFWTDKAETILSVAEAAFAAGACVAFAQPLRKKLSVVATGLTEDGRQIKNSFMVYYLKERTRQNLVTAGFLFKMNANILTTKSDSIPEEPAKNPIQSNIIKFER